MVEFDLLVYFENAMAAWQNMMELKLDFRDDVLHYE